MKRTLRMITVLALVLALCCVTAAATGNDASQAGSDKPSASQNDMTPPQGGGAELQVLVEQGIISQDTLDAILKFMEENRPALPEGDNGQNGNPPEKPDGQQSGNAPQMPDGQQAGNAPQMPDGQQPGNAPQMPDGQQPGNAPQMPDGQQPGNAPQMPDDQQPGDAPQMPDGDGQRMPMLTQELLEQLLDADVITQDEYDAILAFQQTSQDTAQAAQG